VSVPTAYEEAIMRTHFGSLYKLIMDDKINPQQYYPYADSFKKIIQLYDVERNIFMVNDKLLCITPNDIVVIFGLLVTGIDLQTTSKDLQTTSKAGTKCPITSFHMRCLESAKDVKK
jgi:hypothetical protein